MKRHGQVFGLQLFPGALGGVTVGPSFVELLERLERGSRYFPVRVKAYVCLCAPHEYVLEVARCAHCVYEYGKPAGGIYAILQFGFRHVAPAAKAHGA